MDFCQAFASEYLSLQIRHCSKSVAVNVSLFITFHFYCSSEESTPSLHYHLLFGYSSSSFGINLNILCQRKKYLLKSPLRIYSLKIPLGISKNLPLSRNIFVVVGNLFVWKSLYLGIFSCLSFREPPRISRNLQKSKQNLWKYLCISRSLPPSILEVSGIYESK